MQTRPAPVYGYTPSRCALEAGYRPANVLTLHDDDADDALIFVDTDALRLEVNKTRSRLLGRQTRAPLSRRP